MGRVGRSSSGQGLELVDGSSGHYATVLILASIELKTSRSAEGSGNVERRGQSQASSFVGRDGKVLR